MIVIGAAVCLLFLFWFGTFMESHKESNAPPTLKEEREDEGFQAVNLIEDAKKITGFDIIEPEIEILTGKKIFVSPNEIRLQYNNQKQKITISKHRKHHNEEEVPVYPLFTKRLHSKYLKFYGKNFIEYCTWDYQGYEYKIFGDKVPLDTAIVCSIADETDPENLVLDKVLQSSDLEAMGITPSEGEETVIKDLPCSPINTRRDAINLIRSLTPVLQITENEIKFESITNPESFMMKDGGHTHVVFSQIYGDLNVGFNQLSMDYFNGTVTIRSNFEKVIHLNKTSTITEKQAKTKSGLSDITAVKKIIYINEDTSVIAYVIKGDGKEVIISAFDGTILKEDIIHE